MTTLAAVFSLIAPQFTKQSPPPAIAEQLKICRDYFANGLPGKAIELIDADRRLISARGDEDCTPLHHAARYGHADAVKWLLDHGADVNAVAYGGSTPLHLAEESKVVEILLARNPDLTIRCRNLDQTPLQSAAANLVDRRLPEDQSRWREIIDLYRRAGVEFDLLTAIYLDDIARVKVILEETPELADHDGSQQRSPLRVAASLGRLDICRYLIDKFPVDVNDFDRGRGYPIIKEALAFPGIVRLLIDGGADLQRRITWQGGRSGIWIVGDNATALHHAASDGVAETIRLLIDHGVDVFATAESGENDQQTALEIAAIFGKAENARAIAKHQAFTGRAADLRQGSLDSALLRCMWFSFADDAERPLIANLLLEQGANPNSSKKGVTTMQWVTRQIQPGDYDTNERIKQVVALLHKHGATVDLFSAVAIGDSEEVARLVKDDPESANSRHADGYPALHFAVSMDHRDIVATLLAAGGDVDIRNRCDTTGSIDETALHCAAFWRRDEIANMLIDAGADVNALTDLKSTPLHNAARMGSVNIAKLLLDHGADSDARDNKNQTPLDWCHELQMYNVAGIEKVFRQHARKK